MISLRTHMHRQVYRDRFIPSRSSSNFDLGTRSTVMVVVWLLCAGGYRSGALVVFIWFHTHLALGKRWRTTIWIPHSTYPIQPPCALQTTPPPGFAQLSAHPEKSVSAGSGRRRHPSLRLASNNAADTRHKTHSNSFAMPPGSKSATGNNSHNTAGLCARQTTTNASDTLTPP